MLVFQIAQGPYFNKTEKRGVFTITFKEDLKKVTAKREGTLARPCMFTELSFTQKERISYFI